MMLRLVDPYFLKLYNVNKYYYCSELTKFSRLKTREIYIGNVGVDWIERAAKSGAPVAMRLLGTIYRDGIFTIRDRVMAYKWFNLASRDNLYDEQFSKKQVIELEKVMTSAEIAEAQKLSRSFRLKKE